MSITVDEQVKEFATCPSKRTDQWISRLLTQFIIRHWPCRLTFRSFNGSCLPFLKSFVRFHLSPHDRCGLKSIDPQRSEFSEQLKHIQKNGRKGRDTKNRQPFRQPVLPDWHVNRPESVYELGKRFLSERFSQTSPKKRLPTVSSFWQFACLPPHNHLRSVCLIGIKKGRHLPR